MRFHTEFSRYYRRLQDFITNYRWDHDGILGAYQEALARVIVGPVDEGMLNVDSSEFVLKGRESVGWDDSTAGIWARWRTARVVFS